MLYQEFKKIYKEEGIQGLFSGAGARVVYLIVGGCVYFGVYEYAHAYLESSFKV